MSCAHSLRLIGAFIAQYASHMRIEFNLSVGQLAGDFSYIKRNLVEVRPYLPTVLVQIPLSKPVSHCLCEPKRGC